MNPSTIVIAVVVFSLLIFVHELGHFLTAKRAGVKVNEFALGMGPALIKFQRGETVYALRAFPIGGFCAMEGESEESGDTRAFCNAGLLRRAIILVAGSAMNLLLGFLLLSILSSQAIGTTEIARFYEGAVSNQALREGDVIVRVNGNRVRTDNDLSYEFMRDRDGVLDLVVLRDGQQVTLDGVAFQTQQVDNAKLLIVDFQLRGIRPNALQAAGYALNWTGSMIRQVWGSVVDLITGRFGLNQLSGPVGVTSAIGEASSMGWRSLLWLVSFISINLGVFNLLPVPALDGGRLVFLAVEALRRKPLNPRVEGAVNGVAFLLLIGLMIFATVNDVLRLF